MDQKEFYSRSELTEKAREQGFDVGDNYFAQKAHRGEGPAYHLAFGRAYYEKSTFNDWLKGKLGSPFKSTADRSVRGHQDTNSGSGGSSHETNGPRSERIQSRKVGESERPSRGNLGEAQE